MEIISKITINDRSGNVKCKVPNFEGDLLTSLKRSEQIMSNDTLVASIVSNHIIDFCPGDNCTINGDTFKINQLPELKKNGTNLYEYTIVFESLKYDLANVIFLLPDNTLDDYLTANLDTLLQIVCDNANRVYGEGVWVYESTLINTDVCTEQFTEGNCLAALQAICGKYGALVSNVLKKTGALDIQTICPLHGPELEGEKLAEAIRLYTIWSSYGVETEGVLVAYASIHGNTAKAAKKLGEILSEKGAGRVVVADLCREDIAEVIEDAFRMDKLVVCASTYDGDLFPPMHLFLWELQRKAYQNRKIGIVENGTWTPMAGKAMRALIEPMKNIEIIEPTVTLRSSLKSTDILQFEELADALLK